MRVSSALLEGGEGEGSCEGIEGGTIGRGEGGVRWRRRSREGERGRHDVKGGRILVEGGGVGG